MMSDSELSNPKTSIDILCSQMVNKIINIQDIYLNRCNLNDENVIKIINAIQSNQNLKIRKLYFNHNDLSDKTGVKLTELLKHENTCLKELGLKRNRLTATSGNLIAEALKNNTSLRVLDISWNSLGVKPNNKIDPKTRKLIPGMSAGDVGRAWGLCFLENKTLVHVDLSYNKINTVDTIALSQDL